MFRSSPQYEWYKDLIEYNFRLLCQWTRTLPFTLTPALNLLQPNPRITFYSSPLSPPPPDLQTVDCHSYQLVQSSVLTGWTDETPRLDSIQQIGLIMLMPSLYIHGMRVASIHIKDRFQGAHMSYVKYILKNSLFGSRTSSCCWVEVRAPDYFMNS